MVNMFESFTRKADAPSEAKTDKKEGEQAKKPNLESKLFLSESEMKDKIDGFLNRPENKDIEITRETARMAVTEELRRANEKIAKAFAAKKEDGERIKLNG